VPFEVLDRTGTPRDPVQFAERVNALISDPDLAQRFGEAGIQRVIERFTWRAVAERTTELYRSLVS
jgi:alpha-maltose-1-phosphate synthase